MHWKTVAAAVAGTKKDARGCQDVAALRVVAFEGVEVLVVALADGAGSARYGGDAAQLIVSTLLTTAARRLKRRLHMGKRAGLWTAVDSEAAFRFARAAVIHAAETQQQPLREWGSTGLLAVLTPDTAVLAQMGDGAICVRRDDVWQCPIWPDLDGYVNVTTFVTHATAPVRMDVGPPADAILLVSDGLQPLVLDYQTSAPHRPFCAGVIAELGKSQDGSKLERDLNAWLSSDAIRSRSDDDVSLAMALLT